MKRYQSRRRRERRKGESCFRFRSGSAERGPNRVEEEKEPEAEPPVPQREVSTEALASGAKKTCAEKRKNSALFQSFCWFFASAFFVLPCLTSSSRLWTKRPRAGIGRPGPGGRNLIWNQALRKILINGKAITASSEVVSLADLNLDNVGYLKVNNLENFKQLNADTVGWFMFRPGKHSGDSD